MIDITVCMHGQMPRYPGDPHFTRHLVSKIGMGNGGCRVSRLTLSAHTGTHVDAPAHFLADGATIDELPADFFSGPARVVAVAGPVVDGETVGALSLECGWFALFRTPNSLLWSEPTFHQDYVALDVSGAEALIAVGVRGVGVDYLSVERPGGSGIVHRILLRANLAIIEGLDLSAAEPGDYELICLPLRLAGSEGAPARAVLIPR